ncbi:hypothetical protein BN1723_003081 [Verticillium longisporum]|uniref:Autophagy-related protein 13 n=1 Tax=Verticillium longisporum TaxID=100787 RepID=A0A0G4LPH6_VERLO|nr:hypothetical protein BN1723_003081 [Verticillium longisporum]
MFRAAAAGPYDEGIAKATDENLTSEDWGAIMELCDRVTTDTNGPKEAVQSMIKRLAHRNANVQLYTLELANALSQNCGKPIHRELSSRAFTDALLKLANDRNTHTQVKAKILERMKDWSDMFSKDAELGIMYDAYYRLKQTNPTLQPPSAPQKTGLTDVDRRKEEEELQMALQLSLQDEERKGKSPEPSSSNAGPSSSGAGAGTPGASQPLQQQSTPVPAGTTAATVSRVRALFDFVPSEPGELDFKKGDVIAVLESVYKDWWRGSLKGKTGIFPLNYVEKLTDPTPDELAREAQMEAEVFAEIKNVEKLLTLLSTSNTAPKEEDNEEISKLYHQTLAIRPKLIKLIEKYSQKKDDFTQLNENALDNRPPPLIIETYLDTSRLTSSQSLVIVDENGKRWDVMEALNSSGSSDDNPNRVMRRNTDVVLERWRIELKVNSATGLDEFGPILPTIYKKIIVFFRSLYVTARVLPAWKTSQQALNKSVHPALEPKCRILAGDPSSSRSTYGAQELATSVYDSPIAPHNPNSTAAYSTSTNYAPDDQYKQHNTSQGAPQSPQHQPSQPQYHSYQPSSAPPGQDHYGSAPSQAPPPIPTGAPPSAPAPLQPAGSAYDARQGLPSQTGTSPQPQYKAYVPPGGPPPNEGPSAPPSDYYRQPGVY